MEYGRSLLFNKISRAQDQFNADKNRNLKSLMSILFHHKIYAELIGYMRILERDDTQGSRIGGIGELADNLKVALSEIAPTR